MNPAHQSPGPPAPQPNQDLTHRVVAALRTVRDPELPVNIYDLGLIYGLDVNDAGDVHVRMTLTTPACPVAQSMPKKVEQAVAAVQGINSAHVELVWEPKWSPERMSAATRLQLGLS